MVEIKVGDLIQFLATNHLKLRGELGQVVREDTGRLAFQCKDTNITLTKTLEPEDEIMVLEEREYHIIQSIRRLHPETKQYVFWNNLTKIFRQGSNLTNINEENIEYSIDNSNQQVFYHAH